MQIQPSDNVINASSVKPVQETAIRIAACEAVANEVGREFADVVNKALQIYQNDKHSVNAAKEALAEGHLETPEAFEQAAQRILTTGI